MGFHSSSFEFPKIGHGLPSFLVPLIFVGCPVERPVETEMPNTDALIAAPGKVSDCRASLSLLFSIYPGLFCFLVSNSVISTLIEEHLSSSGFICLPDRGSSIYVADHRNMIYMIC